MKNIDRRFLIALFLIGISVPFFSQSHYSVEELLGGYISADLDLQKLTLTASQMRLSEKTSQISNSFNFTLETGAITYNSGLDSNRATVSFNPSATLSVPEASNLKIVTESEANYYNSDAAKTAGNDGFKWTDSSISAQIDLISGSSTERKVTLLKAARTVLEAERDACDRALEAEKEFYTKLKNLYTEAADVLDDRKDLYDAKIDLEELKAQGYTSSSSTYRTKDLEVRSYERDVEEHERLLAKDARTFANDCGISFSSSKYEDILAFLPDVIPQSEAVSITDFPSDSYTETESALWDFYINGLDRNSEKDFTLSASGGYTADNSNTNSDSADVGFSAGWKGLDFSAGSSIGIGDSMDGGKKGNSYTFSIALDPSQFRLSAVNNKQKELSAEQDGLTLLSAQKNYETSLLDQQTSLGNIQWSMQSNQEELKLYTDLEKDMLSWYERGVISESEYLETLVNRDKYQLETLIDSIELIIYNAETKLLFCRDSELALKNYEYVSGVNK